MNISSADQLTPYMVGSIVDASKIVAGELKRPGPYLGQLHERVGNAVAAMMFYGEDLGATNTHIGFQAAVIRLGWQPSFIPPTWLKAETAREYIATVANYADVVLLGGLNQPEAEDVIGQIGARKSERVATVVNCGSHAGGYLVPQLAKRAGLEAGSWQLLEGDDLAFRMSILSCAVTMRDGGPL